eukprot:CAMPEP_0117752098 /NCGR_PEP_ID=MMETSP0947-20121206/11400_1 /TAXON_ID=44440 /ORGANISM="Chattonella subsalsa, Strain CCMP2191" /LENGTH=569 /DNA_ID=CAMNT_0005570669 /DNA_START=90 /DNA_END=1799 /DNA_ORIENTATION=-
MAASLPSPEEEGGYKIRMSLDAPRYNSRRSPVLGTHGMVSSSQPLASTIGVQILKGGGNATDAAIGMAAALAVTEPCSTGLGGDCFMLHYDARTKQVEALNGSGRCPRGLTIKRVGDELGHDHHLGEELPTFHAHTVTVPGAAAGWYDAIQKWGSGNLSLSEVLEPAACLAEQGFPVSPITSEAWSRGEAQLRQSRNCQELLSPETQVAPKAGEIFRNPGMAAVLRDLGTGGKELFYGGWVGCAIVEEVQSHGGCLTLEDLQSHESTFPEPISVDYKGYRIWEVPPNGQGITALLAINLLKCIHQDDESLEHGSSSQLHKLIEALRIAFADTRWYCADPDKVDVPIDKILSEEYARKRAKLFNTESANQNLEHGYPVSSSCTVSFQVVDTEGNAVSFVNSNYMGFGTGLIPQGCGFSLQNRGFNFSLNPQHPNCLSPGKRPYHTIIPMLITLDSTNELFATLSNMGAFMQPQGHVQLLWNLVEENMDPQSAIDSPRFCILDGRSDGIVALEDGIPATVEEELQKMGHKVQRIEGYERLVFGRAQIIVKAKNGVLWAGSDGRCDGCAMGW